MCLASILILLHENIKNRRSKYSTKFKYARNYTVYTMLTAITIIRKVILPNRDSVISSSVKILLSFLLFNVMSFNLCCFLKLSAFRYYLLFCIFTLSSYLLNNNFNSLLTYNVICYIYLLCRLCLDTSRTRVN